MPDAPVVPVQHRHDGWTVERQRRFLFALADTGCVSDAAAEAGLSVRSAYRLRRRLGAEAFAAAWDEALVAASRRLAAVAYERAINGVARPVWHKGEQVGEERRYNDRLLMFLLRHGDPLRFGHLAGLHPHAVADPRDAADGELKRLVHRLTDEAATEPLIPGSDT
ncbi:hypothetical protein [Sphingomonas jatrophae]|uniref:Uncharacterized protein n=1 Tax=Sphingomonas jatrophae TaxID=1166337 RepID=A0A1I6LE32_9SPHN|nr:hypothetical protein [Sphingomonas jatrophae]SFS01686.1 hypothetical protein SAMN05192580_2628 [Sphingomonas jatrophae]